MRHQLARLSHTAYSILYLCLGLGVLGGIQRPLLGELPESLPILIGLLTSNLILLYVCHRNVLAQRLWFLGGSVRKLTANRTRTLLLLSFVIWLSIYIQLHT
ncbi:hypothetical protein [Cohnella lupini]|uniref:Uncharacterized protein n=1 Tax=Cohnella lupini TaxID=1294267 RepID=A0A3D9HZN0_9BACL|nr:hypothetical protein [Cohnella lupini]RED54944.1 hypothetical protein DFP95_12037 [Cohnella lupini]